ncbi:Kinesin-4 -like protein [Gossypium arboreum]|uniref:Kinesin-4-like protein n=1 Tax=Gossypium arboreum TaxID=29729 RepID=A0A0B0NXX1_GOSAR|nr:Kinesin-4 -like protein [Gossypium arboreum]
MKYGYISLYFSHWILTHLQTANSKLEEQEVEKQELMKLVKENEKNILELAAMRQELDIVGMVHKFCSLEMEAEAKVAIAILQLKIKELECLLADSNNKVKELEASFESKCQSWTMKEKIYQSFIDFQFEAMQKLRSSSEAIKQEVLETQKRYSFEFNHLESKLKAVTDAAGNYHEVLKENHKLFSELQDLKGNIRIYCQIRLFLPGQTVKLSTIENISENGQLVIANPSKPGKDGQRSFKFNKIFGPDATQGEVFADIQPFVKSVVNGYNVCIFAYGQTGSGKTYTMTGPTGATEEEWGVNYLVLNHLFKVSQDRKSNTVYEVAVQMVEIYNEQVRDLLSSDAVPEACMHPVISTSDVLDLMDIGFKNRAVSATALNARSSRSHSIVTVHVRGRNVKTGTVLYGNLHLIDLAGSERVDRSEVTGHRLREAQHINKSLSSLGDVIFALAKKSPHVPYRNSKLTQVLQSSLGGQAKTIMLVQLNPDATSFSESMSTLKFAERVSGVELGAAQSSKEEKDVRELLEQMASLKDKIAEKDEEIRRLKSLRDLKPRIPQQQQLYHKFDMGKLCSSAFLHFRLQTDHQRLDLQKPTQGLKALRTDSTQPSTSVRKSLSSTSISPFPRR